MRTLAIGLDGASWNVLDPLLETGELPNLARLRAESAHGVLESTVPFYTAAAWVSFATAASPGAHGIYDFLMLREGGELSVPRRSDLRRATYYDVLGAERKRSVLINFPLDQEASEGAVIVNSWLTADEARRIFPPDRRERYATLLDAYVDYPTTFEEELDSHLEDLCALESSRFALAQELFLREDWDHFFVLFSSTDWLGHKATGRFLAGDPAARGAFLRLYRDLDGYLGWFVEHAPDAAIAVLSDHGLCALTHDVRVNTVLRELGLVRLLHERPGPAIRVPTSLSGLRRIPLLRRLVRALRGVLHSRLGVELHTPRRALDVDRVHSQAFSPTVASYAVYARDCGEGEIRRIAEALADLSLDDGAPAFDGVWTPDELYGRTLPDGPSLVFAPTAGVRPCIIVRQPVVENVSESGHGAHQRDGVLILGGPGTVPRDLGQVSIYDVSPTLLWAMGAPVLSDGDGRVLFEAFSEDFAAERELREVDASPADRPAPGREPDARELEKRLKDLGYI